MITEVNIDISKDNSTLTLQNKTKLFVWKLFKNLQYHNLTKTNFRHDYLYLLRPKKKKKKELCLSFLKVKTVSAMRFFFNLFFLVKKSYADAEIPPNFFLLHFSATIFFLPRPLRGRFLTFFSISRKKKMKKLKISQKPKKKKKKKCGKFGFLKAMRAGSRDRLFFFFGLTTNKIIKPHFYG